MGKWLDSAARKVTMARLLKSQDGRCCYCRKILRQDVRARHPDRATLEHRVPRAAGGTSGATNIAAACRDCNRRKGSQPEEDFLREAARGNDIAERRAVASSGWSAEHMMAGTASQWRNVLLELPNPSLEIFLLTQVEGWSYAKVARELGIPVWLVSRHMLKCIRYLADAVEATAEGVESSTGHYEGSAELLKGRK